MSTRLLQVYITDDGQIWAEDKVNRTAYRLQHTVGSTDYPPAPLDAPGEAPGAGKPADEPPPRCMVASSLSLESEDQAFRAELAIDPVGGDVMAKSIEGPNAGKEVNLTYGRWIEIS